VEAQCPDTSCSLIAPIATAQRRSIEGTAEHVGEHQIIAAGEVLAATDAIQCSSSLIGERPRRTRPDFMEDSQTRDHRVLDGECRVLEVHIAAAQRYLEWAEWAGRIATFSDGTNARE
jgi:hypothetical protein